MPLRIEYGSENASLENKRALGINVSRGCSFISAFPFTATKYGLRLQSAQRQIKAGYVQTTLCWQLLFGEIWQNPAIGITTHQLGRR
jgi:hypothetical protein